MSTLKIIENKKDWTSYLNRMYYGDFYFTYDNHKISVKEPNKFLLFAYEEAEFTLILPLIIRPIPDADGFFDATSVYGYAGPMSSHKDVPTNVLNNFQKELNKKFLKYNLVAVFSRLHPYFENEKYIYQLGDILNLSETVYIDLKIKPEEQYRQYRKGVKSDIKALIREGHTVFEDSELKYISEFIEMYNENMRRVNADSMYFFSEEYYRDFFSSDEIGAKLFFVKKNDEIAAGSIINFSKSVIQYHLSATKTKYLKNSPIRLILNHIRLEYTAKEQEIFHLGGGVGSAKDSLFNFKAGFSKSRLNFKIWKYIVNKEKYDELCKKEGVEETESYFPAYRANNKIL